MLGQGETIKDFQYRFPVLFGIICGLFVLLTVRLVYLQLYRGHTFRLFSEQNSLRREKVPGPRGQIFDRDQKLLVDNRLQLDITLTPQFVKNQQEVVQKIAEISGEIPDRLYDRFKQKLAGSFKFQPVTVIDNAPWPTIVKIESARIPGVEVESRIRRTYLHQQIGSHLFGYLSEVTKNDIEDASRVGLGEYQLGDWIGRSGLEKKWEKYLRGVDGARYVEVDAHGKRRSADPAAGALLHDLPPEVEPQPGKSLTLTIDEDLQLAAAEKMKGKMGAAVAIDPRTGEVLAMLSQPGFDPTEMGAKGPELWQSIVKNPYAPLRNKAIQDHFPAGSTFKPFTALAGLDAGVINENTTVRCTGFFKFGSTGFHCHKKNGHGVVNLEEAITGSCDVYFYSLAAKLGIDPISKMAMLFGFGQKTGIELPQEVPGLMPTEEWKMATYHQPWNPGETLSAAIGQGANLVTPLQLATAYSTLVNGGILYRPYVLSKIEDIDGNVVKRYQPEVVSKVQINPKHLDIIKRGLFNVANSPQGTAYRFVHTADSLISGKSGTAQVMSFNKIDLFKPCNLLPFEKRHHAWFVGYAPKDNPEIVVAVLGMHECGGSVNASPVVRAVIEKWWAKKKQGEGPAQARNKVKLPASTEFMNAEMPLDDDEEKGMAGT